LLVLEPACAADREVGAWRVRTFGVPGAISG
jgi:hypothetical protein